MDAVASAVQVKKGNTPSTGYKVMFDGKAEEWIDNLNKEASSQGIQIEYCVPHYFSSNQKQRDPGDIIRDFKNYI